MARGLNYENILHPDIFVYFNLDFTVTESFDLGVPHGNLKVFTDAPGQFWVGITGKYC
jgi:hypothetical protein